jgi:hypothetical protein
VNHEIAVEIKRKDWEGKLTLGWFAFLVGCCSPQLVFFPLSAMALGVFPPEKQGEKTWGDGSVCEWICRALRGLFY